MEFSLTQNLIFEDIHYLHKTLSENNPFKFLKERTHHVMWDDLLDHFISQCETIKTPEDYIRMIAHICKSAKCGHIYIASDWLIDLNNNNQVFEKDSPWRIISDDDNNYQRNLYWNDVRKQAEKQNTSNSDNTIPQRHVVHALELDSDTMYISIPMMRYPNDAIMKIYKEVATSITNYRHLIIDIRGNYGGGDDAWISFLSMIICEDLSTPLYFFYRSGSHVKQFCEYALKDDDVQTIDQDYFASRRMTGMIDSILFTNEFAPPLLINDIVHKNEDSVNYSGNISVIMDKCNFSSAEAFLVRVKHNKLATLIGETSGGDGVGCSPAIFILPNSKLCLQYPVLLGLNPDGTINDEYPVAPDIHTRVKPFDKPLNQYEDNGLAWLRADEAVQKAMSVFSGSK